MTLCTLWIEDHKYPLIRGNIRTCGLCMAFLNADISDLVTKRYFAKKEKIIQAFYVEEYSTSSARWYQGTKQRKNIAFTPFNNFVQSNILSKLDENSWNMLFPVSGIFSKESH